LDSLSTDVVLLGLGKNAGGESRSPHHLLVDYTRDNLVTTWFSYHLSFFSEKLEVI
jgi:hypothetical protein